MHDIIVSSAGTRAEVGHPIHEKAASVLKKHGGDPTTFAARRLDLRTLRQIDLVLPMTRAHREAVLELAPKKLHRTFTLAEAAWLATEFDARTLADLATLRPQLRGDEVVDIPDPIGQSSEVFSSVGAQIADLLPPVLELCRRSVVARQV